MSTRYHYFISGSIGVGKSAAINALMVNYSEKIKLYYVREYIDYDCFGPKMLDDWISGKMSLLDFQFYIVNCFREQLETEEYTNAKFVIWERHPLEALEVFSKNMNKEDKEKLREVIRCLLEEFDVPEISTVIRARAIKISTYCLTSNSIADIIYNDIINNIANIKDTATFVFLYVPKPFITEQQKRIFKRNRPMEVMAYQDISQLQKINDNYAAFANEFLAGGYVHQSEI